MLKINYPQDFDKNYIKAIGITNDMRTTFKLIISKDPFLTRVYELDDILIAPFEELYKISKELKYLYISNNDKETLKELLNYDNKKFTKKFHSSIKYFFEKNLNIKTCYFCNIDYINSFNDISDYHNKMDFIMRANENELCKIKDIGIVSANEIIAKRDNILSLRNIRNGKKIIKNVNKMLLKEKYSHFTLDHLLDKGENPLIALSLYNLVPSCYSCNTKFKGRNQFIKKESMTHLSSTSSEFKFDKDVKFKLYFFNGKRPSLIHSKKDFILDFTYSNHEDEYKNYIDIFKLKSRYIFHKDEVVEMVKNLRKYPQSRIDEIAKSVGIPSKQIKKDIFGKELFDGNLEDKSMTKFKRDIAESLGLISIKS